MDVLRVFPIIALFKKKFFGRCHNKGFFLGGTGICANAAPHTIVRGNLQTKLPFRGSHGRNGNKVLRGFHLFRQKERPNTRMGANESALIALYAVLRYPFWKGKGSAVFF